MPVYRERLIVKAEADIARKERNRRQRILRLNVREANHAACLERKFTTGKRAKTARMKTGPSICWMTPRQRFKSSRLWQSHSVER